MRTLNLTLLFLIGVTGATAYWYAHNYAPWKMEVRALVLKSNPIGTPRGKLEKWCDYRKFPVTARGRDFQTFAVWKRGLKNRGAQWVFLSNDAVSVTAQFDNKGKLAEIVDVHQTQVAWF